jgi:hypothetical protein
LPIETPGEQAPEVVVHGIFQVLLATEVTLGGQNRRMTQKELYLLQFTTVYVAKLRAGPPKIMRCEAVEF